MLTLLCVLLLVGYIFTKNIRLRAAISGGFTVFTLSSFLTFGGLLNLVFVVLWGYLFFRDLRFAGYIR